jgi:hypothetical protein
VPDTKEAGKTPAELPPVPRQEEEVKKEEVKDEELKEVGTTLATLPPLSPPN